MEYHMDSYTGAYFRKSQHHLYISPCEELQDIVAHYTITFPNAAYPIQEGSVLHLIPDVSGCFVFKFYDKLQLRVWGPTTKVVTLKNDLNSFPCRFFVEFLPGGLHRILGESVRGYVDEQVDMERIFPALYEEIADQFQRFTTFDEIVDYMNVLLYREMMRHRVRMDVYEWIQQLYRTPSRYDVNSMLQELDMSERQLNRYFHKYTGLSSKRFMKFVNVNHLIQEICNKKLLDLAYDYSYFDQAHFNHVFKDICGASPSHYLKNMSDFYNEIYKF